MIRAVVVDDQELVRTGVRRILNTASTIDVVGEASDGDEVEAVVQQTSPDLVLMDVRMKRVDGVTATKRLLARWPELRVLVLTTFDDDETLSGALRAGASGFLLKDAPGEDVVRAVEEVAGG
ncbi:MAG TPA: response regulator transcription factor, partial [Acidimicrobiales bacterium]